MSPRLSMVRPAPLGLGRQAGMVGVAPIMGQSLTGFIFVNDRGGPGSQARLLAQARESWGGGKLPFSLKGGGHFEPLPFSP